MTYVRRPNVETKNTLENTGHPQEKDIVTIKNKRPI